MVRAIDLFCGSGGMTLGFKKARVETVCAIDKRKDAIESFGMHTPDADIRCTDIRGADFAEYRGKVDLIYGGPPCQPFSTGGLRKGTQDSRNMIPSFLKAVEQVKPKALCIENVPGLAVRSRIGHLLEVIESIRMLGYRPQWRVLTASEYGVPQKRRRLFIVALRDHVFRFPRPTHGPGTGRALIPSSKVISHEPLGDPPNCPVIFAKAPDLRRSPYAGHIYNGGGRPVDLNAPCHTILASAGGYKTHWIDTEGIATKYHAHLLEGGEPWEGEVPGARRMTLIESALVQTFPKSMKFAGSLSSQYTQVGDAVPPKLAERVGRSIVAQMKVGGVHRSCSSPGARPFS